MNASELRWIQVNQVSPCEIKSIQVNACGSKWIHMKKRYQITYIYIYELIFILFIEMNSSEPRSIQVDQVSPSESKSIQVSPCESKWIQVSPHKKLDIK